MLFNHIAFRRRRRTTYFIRIDLLFTNHNVKLSVRSKECMHYQVLEQSLFFG